MSIRRWIDAQLAQPKDVGDGRNNQIISVAPRMMELGWAEQDIFDRFKAAYGLEDDSSKDDEIWKVIGNARKYAGSGSSEDAAASREKAWHLTSIRQAAGQELERILTSYSWTFDEVRELGWCSLAPEEQRRRFLGTMFQGDEVIWTGDKFHSGKPQHAGHFRPALDWIASRSAFPFVSHCTFQCGAFSRCNESVAARRYLVVESDHLSHDQMLSLFCGLHHDKGMVLRAAVFSGKRSIHGWFDWPSNDPRELAAFIEGLKCDPATLRASQPVRLAGARRKETNRIQELLFLRE